MNEAVGIALISGIVSIFTSLIGVLVLWLKMQNDKTDANTKNTVMSKKVSEVHDIVNSQRAEMQAEISALKETITAMTIQRAILKDRDQRE